MQPVEQRILLIGKEARKAVRQELENKPELKKVVDDAVTEQVGPSVDCDGEQNPETEFDKRE